jgi:hypothetical protein
MVALPRSLFVPLLLVAGVAGAHHSPAMFDGQNPVSLTGTVREFQWTNPHCYVQLMVRDAAGNEVEWSLEMGAPLYLYNRGWRPSTLKAGDAIAVRVAPLRDGRKAGLLMEASRGDGSPLGKVSP